MSMLSLFTFTLLWRFGRPRNILRIFSKTARTSTRTNKGTKDGSTVEGERRGVEISAYRFPSRLLGDEGY